ncbi:pyruvate ferredoxin oxidoreductase [archaeon]|nr:pyruvate ferredoxin oxidoreductase [archaeon]
MSTEILNGNHTAAYAAFLCDVDVVAAYPITPQTPVVELIAEFVESGRLKARFIRVESEHSAMSVCVGAAFAGARTFTATASQGLALMHEVLHWAAGARLPIVMCNVNRALGSPWSIWADYSDSAAQRDTGWLQVYCKDNQEILDSVIQGYRISEDSRVLLPVMVCYEGFILSHTYMPVHLPPREEILDYAPKKKPSWALNFDAPYTHGNLVLPVHFQHLRRQMHEAMQMARKVIVEAVDEFRKRFGRFHGALVETYQMEDAEHAIVSIGSLGAESFLAVDLLREEGLRVGAVRVRFYRPFPSEELRQLLKEVHSVTVFDRFASYGKGGMLSVEVRDALFELKDPPAVHGYVVGLGGVDVPYTVLADFVRRTVKDYAKVKRREEVIML